METRGDSVRTLVDLEALGKDPSLASEDVVPVQHVRRLTTTLVDILRHVANPQRELHGESMGLPSTESSALLADTASEMSYNDDKLSSYSSRAGTSASRDTVDSQMSAQTALLKAAYLPQEEYKGDEVRPFYMDNGDWTPHSDGEITLKDKGKMMYKAIC